MTTTNKSTLADNNSQPTNLAKRRSFTTLGIIAGLALLASMPVTASAQITWGDGTQLTGSGYAARVAVDGQNAVEVHQLDSGSGKLEYRTGKVTTTGSVTWNTAKKYDTGLSPSIALSGTSVVEVHEETGGEIWYHTGQLLSTGTIKWAAAINLEAGYAPSVAASGTQVIEVHQASDSNPSALWYKSGQFNPDGTITFSAAAQYDSGFAPAVALGGATIVEVHQGTSPALWYNSGTVNAGNSISFSEKGQFDSGFAPTVAIAGPTIAEAHEDGSGNNWYSIGLLQSNGTIVWGASADYQPGTLPSIAIAGARCRGSAPRSYRSTLEPCRPVLGPGGGQANPIRPRETFSWSTESITPSSIALQEGVIEPRSRGLDSQSRLRLGFRPPRLRTAIERMAARQQDACCLRSSH